jgi:hypothetical protein
MNEECMKDGSVMVKRKMNEERIITDGRRCRVVDDECTENV